MSDSSIRTNPSIEEPSNMMRPSSASSNCLSGTSTFLIAPRMSVNCRRMNFTFSRSARSRMRALRSSFGMAEIISRQARRAGPFGPAESECLRQAEREAVHGDPAFTRLVRDGADDRGERPDDVLRLAEDRVRLEVTDLSDRQQVKVVNAVDVAAACPETGLDLVCH